MGGAQQVFKEYIKFEQNLLKDVYYDDGICVEGWGRMEMTKEFQAEATALRAPGGPGWVAQLDRAPS